MSRHDKRTGRNFGWGKQLAYASQNALQNAYRTRPTTATRHAQHFKAFATWLKEHCAVRDARDITREHLDAYGTSLREQRYATATIQNALSAINVTLECLREDRKVRISPSRIAGTISTVRSTAPNLSRSALDRVVASLRDAGHARAAVSLLLARELGLRMRETALADTTRLLREATSRGEVNITEGTKGGRGKHVDRWVPATSSAIAALKIAAALQGERRNLIPEGSTLKQYQQHLRNVTKQRLHDAGMGTRHDLRAAYACERYRQLTGHDAPCVAGKREATKEQDKKARKTITQELGHGRIGVVSEYVGSAA